MRNKASIEGLLETLGALSDKGVEIAHAYRYAHTITREEYRAQMRSNTRALGAVMDLIIEEVANV